MFFRRKKAAEPSPPPEQALHQELNRMLSGYGMLAEQIAKGKLETFPEGLNDVTARAEPLFLGTAADGTTQGRMYHYTDDFQTIDPNAQLDLVTLFGGPQTLKGLIGHYARGKEPAVLEAAVTELERQRAGVTSFLRSLARYDLSGQVLARRISPEAFQAELPKLRAADEIAFKALLGKALLPKTLIETLTARPPRFVVMLASAVQESEPKRFNGVWLPPERTQAFLDHLAQKQAESLAGQRHG